VSSEAIRNFGAGTNYAEQTLAVGLVVLKAPVTRTAASVRHGHDLDYCVGNSNITEYGKRRRRYFLVPCECRGQRAGLFRMILTASSRATMKAAAAEGLRVAYQS
jgi:hypothetical protein